MHEMSLAASIVEIVLEEAAKGATREAEKEHTRDVNQGHAAPTGPTPAIVSVVHFRAGRLHSILPESLTFYYDQMKLEHESLKESALNIALIAERARCQVCNHEFEIDAPIFVCPVCSGPAVITDGQEMYIEKIEMELASPGLE